MRTKIKQDEEKNTKHEKNMNYGLKGTNLLSEEQNRNIKKDKLPFGHVRLHLLQQSILVVLYFMSNSSKLITIYRDVAAFPFHSA